MSENEIFSTYTVSISGYSLHEDSLAFKARFPILYIGIDGYSVYEN